tara:strand:- start:849 stop:1460 length:612 start_codon:yes stop_codon:yes gene_type:complete
VTELLLYSSNQSKLTELNKLFEPFSLTIHQPSDLEVTTGVSETGTTFLENAIIKARDGCRQAGLPCVADDSGLFVNAIGKPGVMSARYAGEGANDDDNVNKLLSELRWHDSATHAASFYCCLVYLRSFDDPMPLIAEGVWHGSIISERSGSNGFGYDPIFYLPDLKKTVAELDVEVKMKLSHRAKAGEVLKQKIQIEYQSDAE